MVEKLSQKDGSSSGYGGWDAGVAWQDEVGVQDEAAGPVELVILVL